MPLLSVFSVGYICVVMVVGWLSVSVLSKFGITTKLVKYGVFYGRPVLVLIG